MRALALISGGLDSIVMLHEYKEQIRKAMFIYYNSKHNDIEGEYAKKACDKLGIPFIFINASDTFLEIGKKSALMKNGGELPKNISPEDSAQSSTVVPFRNGILISIAVAYAWENDLNMVLIGANEEDSAVYPDCRKSFIVSMDDAIKYGTETRVGLFAPFLVMEKGRVIDAGMKLDIDLSNETYSCYEGGHVHCGACGACLLRRKVLGERGIDSTKYLE